MKFSLPEDYTETISPETEKRSWIGLFKSDGEFVERIVCDQPVTDYMECIDKSKLPSGKYFVIIQSSCTITTGKFEV